MGEKQTSKRLAERPVSGHACPKNSPSTTGRSSRLKRNCATTSRGEPSWVALMKLRSARLREGFSLGEMAEKAGIDRGNLSKLENNGENVELTTLMRLADVSVPMLSWISVNALELSRSRASCDPPRAQGTCRPRSGEPGERLHCGERPAVWFRQVLFLGHSVRSLVAS